MPADCRIPLLTALAWFWALVVVFRFHEESVFHRIHFFASSVEVFQRQTFSCRLLLLYYTLVGNFAQYHFPINFCCWCAVCRGWAGKLSHIFDVVASPSQYPVNTISFGIERSGSQYMKATALLPGIPYTSSDDYIAFGRPEVSTTGTLRLVFDYCDNSVRRKGLALPQV